MPATVDDIPNSLAPLWVIDKRLSYHSEQGSGRIADGFKYDREGCIEADGVEDLPYAQPVTIQDQEGISSGSGANVSNTRSLYLHVAARREYGLFRRNPKVPPEDSSYDGVGVLEWVERVRDAIETSTDGLGEIDPLLEGDSLHALTDSHKGSPCNGYVMESIAGSGSPCRKHLSRGA